MKLDAIIDNAIRDRLKENDGNQSKTARELGVSTRYMRYKVRQFEQEDTGGNVVKIETIQDIAEEILYTDVPHKQLKSDILQQAAKELEALRKYVEEVKVKSNI